MYDVIIVGAGPAGSACSKRLAENGFSVKIYDRREELGVPVRCGEGLTENAESLTGKIPEKCISQRIKGGKLYAPNGAEVNKSEGSPGSNVGTNPGIVYELVSASIAELRNYGAGIWRVRVVASDVPDDYVKQGDAYVSPGYDDAKDRIELKTSVGVGQVVVREYSGE